VKSFPLKCYPAGPETAAALGRAKEPIHNSAAAYQIDLRLGDDTDHSDKWKSYPQQRGSIMLTSNRSPGEWPGLFGNPLLAAAGLDRLAHHAEIVVIQGDSFRAHGRQKLEEEVKIEIAN